MITTVSDYSDKTLIEGVDFAIELIHAARGRPINVVLAGFGCAVQAIADDAGVPLKTAIDAVAAGSRRRAVPQGGGGMRKTDAITRHHRQRDLERWLRDWFINDYFDVDDNGEVTVEIRGKWYIVGNIHALAGDLAIYLEENDAA
jgi:hypothetical protein